MRSEQEIRSISANSAAPSYGSPVHVPASGGLIAESTLSTPFEVELTPEREKEVREKFERWATIRKQQARMPDFPPYQNLPIPVGCKKDRCALVCDWQFLGKVYEVSFEFELVFGSQNARTKKFNSMETMMKALLQLSSLSDLNDTPGFTVKDKGVAND